MSNAPAVSIVKCIVGSNFKRAEPCHRTDSRIRNRIASLGVAISIVTTIPRTWQVLVGINLTHECNHLLRSGCDVGELACVLALCIGPGVGIVSIGAWRQSAGVLDTIATQGVVELEVSGLSELNND